MHAQHLAHAERRLTEKQAAYAEAQDRLNAIRARLDAINGERDKLVLAQREGAATPRDGLKFAALNKDASDLQAALAEAQAEADALRPTEADQKAVNNAQAMLAKHEAAVKLSALQGKAAELDALLVRIIGDIREAGRLTGEIQLYRLWTPSPELDRIIKFELPR